MSTKAKMILEHCHLLNVITFLLAFHIFLNIDAVGKMSWDRSQMKAMVIRVMQHMRPLKSL